MEASISKNSTLVEHESFSESLDPAGAQSSENAENVTNINISGVPIEMESFNQVGITSLPVSLIQLRSTLVNT